MPSGEVLMYYFGVDMNDIRKISIDGKEIDPSMYIVSESGEGSMVMISEDAVSLGSGLLTVDTDTESVESSINKAAPSVPTWLFIILGIWNLLLTAGIAVIVVKNLHKAQH